MAASLATDFEQSRHFAGHFRPEPGPSPIRTGLPRPKLPANREIYREFAHGSGCPKRKKSQQMLNWAHVDANSRRNGSGNFWRRNREIRNKEQGAVGGRTRERRAARWRAT